MSSKNSNDNIPEDEILLAELIAAASEKSLFGCKDTNYMTFNGSYQVNYSDSSVACCAVGAAMLAGLNRLVEANILLGNDASENTELPKRYGDGDGDAYGTAIRNWNIGAAFNLAMDPTNEV